MYHRGYLKKCKICKKEGIIPSILGVCPSCIKNRTDKTELYINSAHKKARKNFDLPASPPKKQNGISCTLCSNECIMGEGERGYCGLRRNIKGELKNLVDSGKGLLHRYYDPHITNCCSAWFCPAGTGIGYPRWSYREDAEYGYSNYAVFFYGCNFNCLYCQNASHKRLQEGVLTPVESFIQEIQGNPKCSCICFFGGSPEPQLPYALRVVEALKDLRDKRIIRVCFEWNGCGNPDLVAKAAESSLKTGGNIKFDLKCSHPEMSIALSGVSNERAYHNFEMIADRYFEERKRVPVLTATTLLVPNYVGVQEVSSIARFISDLNPEIPYSLLVFHPDFYFYDMPVTPKRQVEECYQAAKRLLKRVHIGNLQLLGFGNHSP